MVLHSSRICLLERAFLFNKRMPCMWEGESPLGNGSSVASAMLCSEQREGLRQTAAPHLKPGTAIIFLPCFGARFLLEVCSDLQDMHDLLWDLPSFTTSLGQPQWVQMPMVEEERPIVLPSPLRQAPPGTGAKRTGFPSAMTPLPMLARCRGCKEPAEYPPRCSPVHPLPGISCAAA